MSKKKKAIIAVSVILSSIILIIAVFSVREKILRRAEWTQGTFEFDGKTYEEIDYHEMELYEKLYEGPWNVVCKTTDGVWTIYEIEQDTNHKYVIAQTDRLSKLCKLVD